MVQCKEMQEMPARRTGPINTHEEPPGKLARRQLLNFPPQLQSPESEELSLPVPSPSASPENQSGNDASDKEQQEPILGAGSHGSQGRRG